MKKFKYKLEKLLEIRIKLEEVKKIELGVVSQELKLEKEKEFKLKKEIIEQLEKGKQELENQLNIRKLRIANEYMYIMKNRIKAQEERTKIKEKELENKIMELLEKTRERKILEKLKEKEYARYLKEEKKEEQKNTDEVVSYMYNIKE